MNNVKIFFSIIALLILGMIVTVLLRSGSGMVSNGPGKYDTFAQCLGEKGAKFYGAFWCPYCGEQKKIFGSSAKLLPYVECSTPNGRGQTQVCIDKKIVSYPVWEFADGTQFKGKMSLDDLAERTSCELPVEEVSPTE